MAIDLPLTSPEHAALYRRLGLWKDETICDQFLAASDRVPQKIAIVEPDRSITYGELRRMVDNLAGNILDLGVAPGEVFAIQAPNGIELPLVHLALNRIGRLFMPVHDSWRQTELRHLLRKAKAHAIVIPKEYRGFDHVAMLDEIRGELPDLLHVFVMGGSAPGCRDFAELLLPTRHTQAELAAQRPDPDLPGSIMLSGGTTSISKISRYSSNDLLTMLLHFMTGIEFNEHDVAAALAPAGTGATGYVFPILTPLLHGATSIVLKRWSDPEEAVDLIARNRCTYAVGIPTQLTMMLPALEQRSSKDFAQLRCFFNAGAPLPYATGLRIEQLMACTTASMYGATDGGVPTRTMLKDPEQKRLSTVGRVVDGCECQLWDEDGNPLPVGQPGEVVWRGADKSWGYLGDDEATTAAFTRDGFYKSGDIGQFDEDGYLRIVGRIKDMILRGGRNVSPRTTEELMVTHPAVLEIAVAAMPDPVLGERACAFVRLRPGASLRFDDMIEFLKEQKIAIWQLPERLEIVDDLPRSTGGKVKKAELTAFVTEKLKAEGKLP